MNKLQKILKLFFDKININLPSSLIKIDYYRVFYILFFLIIYISNQHSVEKKVREINKLEKEVEELSTDYVTLKNLIILQDLNLNISKKPPEKISIKDEY